MLIGCMSLPVVQSSVYQESVDDEYQLYDSKSQIRYKISNDRDYLYLTLNTANKFSIMQILKGGLNIYFDTLGKKNEDIILQYPLPLEERAAEVNYKMPNGMQQPNAGVSGQLLRLPRKAIFINNAEIQAYNVKDSTNDIQIRVSSVNDIEINCIYS